MGSARRGSRHGHERQWQAHRLIAAAPGVIREAFGTGDAIQWRETIRGEVRWSKEALMKVLESHGVTSEQLVEGQLGRRCPRRPKRSRGSSKRCK
jgi:hypothetical protein